jgi:DNA uptake protein ComE-like DNA-binding protein
VEHDRSGESRRARERLDRERGVVRAGLLVVLVAWGLTSGSPDPAVEPCLAPRETRTLAGATVAVRCAPEGPVAVHGAAQLLFAQRLDLNHASAASLEALPGIGPGRAAAILAERARAPFASVAELRRVRGIGPRTLAGLEGLVRAG